MLRDQNRQHGRCHPAPTHQAYSPQVCLSDFAVSELLWGWVQTQILVQSKSKEVNFKYAEQPIIEEKPSSSSKKKMDNLVLADCWNEKQVVMFTEQYKWLEIKEGKLGCKDYSTVQHLGLKAEDHVHMSKEWIAYLVTPNGNNKTTRQASL